MFLNYYNHINIYKVKDYETYISKLQNLLNENLDEYNLIESK